MEPRGQDQPGAGLEQRLRLAARELKWVQIELEHTTEALQRARRQRARARDQAEELADALAAARSEAYWQARRAGRTPERGRLGGLLGRAAARPEAPAQDRGTDAEAELVRLVEECELFDAGWYLRQHPKALRSTLAPAVHYVRQGHRAGLDPGPRFSTTAYLERHPEARSDDEPALVHAVRHGHHL